MRITRQVSQGQGVEHRWAEASKAGVRRDTAGHIQHRLRFVRHKRRIQGSTCRVWSGSVEIGTDESRRLGGAAVCMREQPMHELSMGC